MKFFSFFFFFFFFFSFCLCYIDKYSNKLNEPSFRIIRKRFGMVKEGEITIKYSLSVININILAVIIDDMQYYNWYELSISSRNTLKLCNLPSMARYNLYNNGSVTYQIKSTDRYTVLLLLCDEYKPGFQLHATIEMVNPTISHDSWNYLPIQQVSLVRLSLGNVLGFVLMLLLLLGQFYFSKYNNILFSNFLIF